MKCNQQKTDYREQQRKNGPVSSRNKLQERIGGERETHI